MLVYKITNNINNKVYIGQTLRTLKERWSSHRAKSKYKNYPLYSAFKKYGIENFTCEEIEILPQHSTQNLLNETECKWIAHYNSMYPTGYNLKEGGSNGKPSKETRLKLKLAATGRLGSNRGRACSEETKLKLSIANKGQISHNKGRPSGRKGVPSPLKGKKYSEEAKVNMGSHKGVKRGPYKKRRLQMSDYNILPDGRDKRQLKLTSVDFLMAMLRQLGVISEGMAFRCWRKHKSKILA